MNVLAKNDIDRSIFSGLFFDSLIEEQQNLDLKNFIKFHLHGYRGQKEAKKAI